MVIDASEYEYLFIGLIIGHDTHGMAANSAQSLAIRDVFDLLPRLLV